MSCLDDVPLPASAKAAQAIAAATNAKPMNRFMADPYPSLNEDYNATRRAVCDAHHKKSFFTLTPGAY